MSNFQKLLSIAPKYSDNVVIEGVSFEVKPLSLMKIAKILRRFPPLLSVASGEDIDFIKIVTDCGPEAVAAIVVAATGEVNDIEEEVIVQQLPDEWQLELLTKAFELTMPGGVEDFLGKFLPFIERMGMLADKKPEPATKPRPTLGQPRAVSERPQPAPGIPGPNGVNPAGLRS